MPIHRQITSDNEEASISQLSMSEETSVEMSSAFHYYDNDQEESALFQQRAGERSGGLLRAAAGRPESRHSRWMEQDEFEGPSQENAVSIFLDDETSNELNSDGVEIRSDYVLAESPILDSRRTLSMPAGLNEHSEATEESILGDQIETMVVAMSNLRRLSENPVPPQLHIVGRSLGSNSVARSMPQGLAEEEELLFQDHGITEGPAHEADEDNYGDDGTIFYGLRNPNVSDGSQDLLNSVRLTALLQRISTSESDLFPARAEDSASYNRWNTTPHIPSVLATPPHLASSPMTGMYQNNSAMTSDHFHPTSLPSAHDGPSSAGTEASSPLHHESSSTIYDRLRTRVQYLERIFRTTIGGVAPSAAVAQPSSSDQHASRRWRRLVDRRREMFERIWRQELDFWRQVEEQIESGPSSSSARPASIYNQRPDSPEFEDHDGTGCNGGSEYAFDPKHPFLDCNGEDLSSSTISLEEKLKSVQPETVGR